MKSKYKALIIIGATLLVAIGTTITYAALQNKTDSGITEDQEATHIHEDSNMDSSTNSSSDDVQQTNEVTIQDYAYGPATIEVAAGTKVTWTNNDSIEHTVTTEDGAPASFDSGEFGQGESFSFTFDEPGEYNYFCTPHPYMKGIVVVTE